MMMKRLKPVLISQTFTLLFVVLILALANSAVAKTTQPTTATLQPSIPGTFLTGPNEGDPLTIARSYILANHEALQLSEAEAANLVVTDHYQSRRSAVTHIYFVQSHNGIKIHNAVLNMNITEDGRIINIGNRFIPNLTETIGTDEPQITAVDALQQAADHLNLSLNQPPIIVETIGGPARAVTFNESGISQDPIPVNLIYQMSEAGEVRLAWEVMIHETAALDWWNVRVDAVDGRILAQDNYYIHDDWGETVERTDAYGVVQLGATAVPSSYLAYGIPVESPHHTTPLPPADGRTTEVSPWLDAPTASPLGWHATTTTTTTSTEGNNVDTHKASTRYDCGPALECDPPLDLTMDPTTPDNVDSALVNLFYWNNVIHDVTYEYGFDETAGNFQQDNFGMGGLGGDRVDAVAQWPGNCGGGFSTPPDGSQPVMAMYTCNANFPARDGAMDNGVIAHEYGHGVSNRLTGGPQNVSCLANNEAMGEGWSDWLAITMTIEPGDEGNDLRTIGTWLFGQGPFGPGVRNLPFTTDFSENSLTYSDIILANFPHDVGEVWVAMVWDMTWALIDKYGYNPDFYGDWTTGGNNLALQLVIDGLKFQPCSPGFVDGRDAILNADMGTTGGQNQCLIWRAFANRGLGYSASQGSSNSILDGVEAFDMPPECLLLNTETEQLEICAGETAEYAITVDTGFTPDVALSVEGEPNGTTTLFNPNPVTAVPATTTLTIDNTGGLPQSSYTLTISATDSVAVTHTLAVMLDVVPAAPSSPTLISPPNNAIGLPPAPQFEWSAVSTADAYLLELDDNTDFSTLVYSATVEQTTHILPIMLDNQTVYYWRVTGLNICGPGQPSQTFSFTTLSEGPAIYLPVLLREN
jgi:hypothetical protein